MGCTISKFEIRRIFWPDDTYSESRVEKTVGTGVTFGSGQPFITTFAATRSVLIDHCTLSFIWVQNWSFKLPSFIELSEGSKLILAGIFEYTNLKFELDPEHGTQTPFPLFSKKSWPSSQSSQMPFSSTYGVWQRHETPTRWAVGPVHFTQFPSLSRNEVLWLGCPFFQSKNWPFFGQPSLGCSLRSYYVRWDFQRKADLVCTLSIGHFQGHKAPRKNTFCRLF